MKQIIVFIAGGTIATRRSPTLGGAALAAKGDEIVALSAGDDVRLVFEEVSTLPASHQTPAATLGLAQRLESALLAPDLDGAVVACGSDTLEETAYLLDLTVRSSKALVCTAATRNVALPGYDGLTNLADAVRLAALPEARDAGVLVAVGGAVYAASEVQQLIADDPAGFAAPGSGPLGRIDGARVALAHRPARRQHIPCTRIEEMVDLIRAGQGADDRLLRHSLEDGAAGIVIEAFGAGRVPPWWLPAIGEASRRRTVIAIATRCAAGSLGDEYGYVGGYHDLKRAGVLFAHGLSGVKARIKLMVALGAARHPTELRRWFAN
jgi:L-asparaginase